MKKTLVLILSTMLLAQAPAAGATAIGHGDAKAGKPAKVHKHVPKHKKIATKSRYHKHHVARKKTVRHEVRPVAVAVPKPMPPKPVPFTEPEHIAASATAPTALPSVVASAPETVPVAQPAPMTVPDHVAMSATISSDTQPIATSVAPTETPPVIKIADAQPAPKLKLRSESALVVDQQTGEALYAKNPNIQTPIASITKLMTSMVVLDAKLPMDQMITITKQDVDHLKHTHSRLAVGATLSRGELLHLALIASENRAASALCRTYPGGTPACVRAMNAKAAELGMHDTHYVEGTGLNSGNRSTAVDLAKLVTVASHYPVIHRITSTGRYGVNLPGYRVVKVRNKHGKIHRVHREIERRVAFNNTNMLTRNPHWDIGLSKTGFINEAGHCLVMQAKIGERKIIMVLLDSVGRLSRIGDAKRVRHWLENNGDDS